MESVAKAQTDSALVDGFTDSWVYVQDCHGTHLAYFGTHKLQSFVIIGNMVNYCYYYLQAGGRSAGPAHMNSASSAKEAIRLMEADKERERDRDRDASLRSASRDRDGRPRERGSDRGR